MVHVARYPVHTASSRFVDHGVILPYRSEIKVFKQKKRGKNVNVIGVGEAHVPGSVEIASNQPVWF